MKKSELRKLIRESIKGFVGRQNPPQTGKEKASCWKCAHYVERSPNGGWEETGKTRCHKLANPNNPNGCMSWLQCFKSCRLGMGVAPIKIDAKTNQIIE